MEGGGGDGRGWSWKRWSMVVLMVFEIELLIIFDIYRPHLWSGVLVMILAICAVRGLWWLF